MQSLPQILEIATPGRRIRLDRGFIKISDANNEIGSIPIDGITALVASTPAISITGQAVSELANRGTPIVFCGTNFRPSSYVLPVSGHHISGTRLEAQAAATAPIKKQAWAQIIKSKITAQADALKRIGAPDMPVRSLIAKVRSGDTENREATAAQRYWTSFFGKNFRRHRDASGINAMLNYGYTILRASTARAIIAAGLHPALGICHKSNGDGLRLADDLMEPFRPAVDLLVKDLVERGIEEMTTETKRELVGVLSLDYETINGTSTTNTAIACLATSLAQFYCKEKTKLIFPNKLIPILDDEQ